MTEAKSEEECLTMDEVFERMAERVKIIQDAFEKLQKELRHELDRMSAVVGSGYSR